MVVERHLRHDHDEGPAVGMKANGLRKADLRLVHAFGAPFAGAVQEENERPRLRAAPILRQIDHVAMEDAVDFDGAIEKTGVLRARRGVCGQKKNGR